MNKHFDYALETIDFPKVSQLKIEGYNFGAVEVHYHISFNIISFLLIHDNFEPIEKYILVMLPEVRFDNDAVPNLLHLFGGHFTICKNQDLPDYLKATPYVFVVWEHLFSLVLICFDRVNCEFSFIDNAVSKINVVIEISD